MTAKRLLLILWARRWVGIATLGLTVFTTLVASLLMSKSYLASTTLVIDYKERDPLTGAMFPSDLMPSYLATQVDIISSHTVALKVVDALRLTEDSQLRRRFERKTSGEGSFRDWLADDLLRDLEVSPSNESNVITITYTGRDRRLVAELANAFAEAGIRTNLELQVEPARRQAAWFDDQVEALRQAFHRAQTELSAYQLEHNVLPAGNLDVESAHLADLSRQLATAQGQWYESEARLRQMQAASADGRLQDLPGMLREPSLQSLKSELARAEAKLAEMGGRYDQNHPMRRSVAAEVASLRKRLATEIQLAAAAIARDTELARQRVADLQRAVEEQKRRILETNQQRDRLALLARDAENAQRAYEAALQRASQVRLESRLEGGNIAVLSPAIPPIKPSKPKLWLNLLLSSFLGGLLGVGAAILSEAADRRFRSGEDLVLDLGAPLLAEIPPPEQTA
ncbi:MAG TPA: chain length determinant protein EpsF [Methylococcus sp.]|nr:chain length determinant protein EpsF [Methylococcus sp.]